MIPERWQHISELLDEAMQLDSEQRSAFLERLASSDPELRQEVESLLDAHNNAESSFLHLVEPNSHRSAASGVRNAMAGRRFGDYRILEQIGEGGMGEVYRAMRDDDQYRKEVAIKLVRAGQDSGFVVSRFRNERQILASLDHPNIARLLDGGTTEEGMPFFVMELINGETIDKYCDRHGLPVAERLELFMRVCSAVQYAHQRLIIHRDIKPRNILVTSDGVPKLLDFGIAKILDREADNRQLEPTLTLFRVLTPAYASPEQVKGEPITTASDVYSLGVVLYELLTGRHPYRRPDSPPEEIARAGDAEPERPSTAVRRRQSEESGQTSHSPADGTQVSDGLRGKLSKRLRGDLDNIVLMALRKEPKRRYASVEQFAEDVRRHLENLPVIARKDTARYRTSRFIARHKAGVAAAAIVFLTLLAAFVITIREERIAQRRFNDVRSLANSLIFDVHDSIKDLPGSTPARKVIVDRALQYLNSLARESGKDLGLQRELATAYERVGLVQGHYTRDNLGDTKGSLDSYQKALAIRKQVDSKSRDWKDRLALARTYRFVAELQSATGNPHDARDNINHAIAASEALNIAHPNDSQILYEMACDYRDSGGIGFTDRPDPRLTSTADYRKALAADEAALRIQPDDLPTLDAYATDLSRIGDFLEQTDPQAALPYYQKELEISQQLSQKSRAVRYARGVALAYRNISSVYDDLGDDVRSFENDVKYLTILEEINREDPHNVTLRQSLAIAYGNTAMSLAKVGKIKLALADWSKGIEIMRKLVSSAPENTAQRHYLAGIVGAGGTILMDARKPKAALKQFEESRALYQSLRDARAASSFDVALVAACSEKMAEAAALSGQAQVAAEHFHEALAVAEPLISTTPPDRNALYVAADAYSGLGDLSFRKAQKPGQTAAGRKANWTEARSWYARSLETWRRIEHPIHGMPGSAFDVGDPALVPKKLQRCEAALADTRSALSPGTVAPRRHNP